MNFTQGPRGAPGIQGPQGERGERGTLGLSGVRGQPGPRGKQVLIMTTKHKTHICDGHLFYTWNVNVSKLCSNNNLW